MEHTQNIYSITDVSILTNDVMYHLTMENPILLDNEHKLIIDHSLVKSLPLNDKSIIYVSYTYGDSLYILPVEYATDMVHDFPPYTTQDIDTCMKKEFVYIETDKYNSCTDDISCIVESQSGPKGNFYADTSQFIIKPSMLLFDKTGKLLMSNDNDTLRLTTMMGDSYVYPCRQAISDFQEK